MKLVVGKVVGRRFLTCFWRLYWDWFPSWWQGCELYVGFRCLGLRDNHLLHVAANIDAWKSRARLVQASGKQPSRPSKKQKFNRTQENCVGLSTYSFLLIAQINGVLAWGWYVDLEVMCVCCLLASGWRWTEMVVAEQGRVSSLHLHISGRLDRHLFFAIIRYTPNIYLYSQQVFFTFKSLMRYKLSSRILWV